VTFSYPEAGTPALRDMSFTIEPGQLCVIVGENGSGSMQINYLCFAGSNELHFLLSFAAESSTTKLLLRLFDASEGHILIDDEDIREYRSDDIRQATSVLWQDYQSFPLTVRV
jgi:ABC-type multidrug transport system fused ATPase/permease subunit